MAQNNKERLREITENIERGIEELFASDRYAEYLCTMSRFHRYSANNVMLIHMQMPGATHVAGYNRWRDQFGRYVKRGEKGIKIIAPTPYKKKVEEIKRDPDTHAPLLDQDGNAIVEEREIRVPMFRVTTVFDVSQTEGKPLPQLASSLKGDVQHYGIFMEALRRTSPVPLTFERMKTDMDGYFSAQDQRIAIREGMSEVQTVSAAIHEIAHSMLHNPELDKQQTAWRTVMVSGGGTVKEYIGGFATEEEAEAFAESEHWRFRDENGFVWQLEVEEDKSAEKKAEHSRQTEEVEAESISYAVCQYYGIETGENSFGYIASWSKGRELKELKSSLELINKTAGSLINDIDRHFAEICKEKGIGLEDGQQEEALAAEQPGNGKEAKKAGDGKQDIQAGKMEISYYVAECMEFPGLGEYHERLSLSEAVRLYEAIPAKRMNGIKGIGFQIEGDGLYGGASIPILNGGTIDVDAIYGIGDFRNDPLVQKAVGDLIAAVLDAEVIRHNQPETVQPLDEYPMPDSIMDIHDLERAGYPDGDMLPLTKERAGELLNRDFTVYAIVDGGQAELMLDMGDIEALPADGVFAVSKEEWEGSREFDGRVQERRAHQEEREAAFLSHTGDCFAIYQVKDGEALLDIRFEPLDRLKAAGRDVERGNYDLVYTAPLPAADDINSALNDLWYRFNHDHPADYHSQSMSVSDIIAIRQGGRLSCHYCDRYGFKELDGFLEQNPLKNTEMSVEDDYGMAGGIINNGEKQPTVAQLEQQARSGKPISLLDLADAVRREEQQKRKSVVGQLKAQPRQGHKKTAPGKGAEREI